MIIDKLLEFSDKQEITASAPSTVVTNVFVNNSPNTSVDLGVGEPTWLVVQLAQAGASGTLKIQLETSDQSDMAGATVLATSGDIDVSAAKGNLCAIPLPSANYKKYLRVNYTATSPANLFVNAFIVKDIDANRAYAPGSTIV